MEKQALRHAMKTIRSSTERQDRSEWSRKIEASLRSSEIWQAAKTIGLYASFRGEVDTWHLLEGARTDGKTVALPKVTRQDGPLSFFKVEKRNQAWPLEAGKFGVQEPNGACPIFPHDQLELILVPALAISKTGDRLGWGGGFYDRTLPLMSGAKKLALIFDCQIIESVPTGPGDHPVDGWVSESGVVLL